MSAFSWSGGQVARSADPGDEQPAEPFRGLLLRHRGRTGLTQKELAARTGVHLRSIQDWEAGISYPRPERFEAVVTALLQAGGFASGQERREVQSLWAALEREAPAYRAPFDAAWFDGLLARAATPSAAGRAHAPRRRQDWGEAPDVRVFVGRADALATLRRWVVDEHCRVVAVLGMGGIGKTSLAAKLARDVARRFERVYWRSLRDAPPLSDWLAGALGFLSDQEAVLPASEAERLTAVLELLRARRCLLVLDNFETLFEPGEREGHFRESLAGYGRLLRVLGEAPHQSCLLLTSREAPLELAMLGDGLVRAFRLGGLELDEARALLSPKQLAGTDEQWAELLVRFGGNGLALNIVGETIREVFGGDLGAFLAVAEGGSIFGDIRRLLSEQVERSSPLEQRVLRVLAVAREPVGLNDLLHELGPPAGPGLMLETVGALRRRSLVERAETAGVTAFTLQSVVLEYVTDRLVEDIADEIVSGRPRLLVEQPLVQALAKDYVRHTQERLIGEPILRRLHADGGSERAEQHLLALLEGWRAQPAVEQGYGPGNVVNLLRLLRGDLRGLNLSRLALRQVYLQGIEAQDGTLAHAHLAETLLGDVFDAVGSLAVQADGTRLAAGTLGGQVIVWRLADRTPLMAVRAHSGGIWGVALSQDGRLLASGGDDGTVRLWDAEDGRLERTITGHDGAIYQVAFSNDGRLLASASLDRTIRLWDTAEGGLLSVLEGHTSPVHGVAFHPDGRRLASASADGTVRIWDIANGELLGVLGGHTAAVVDVAISPDGRLLASSSYDGTVRLWHMRSLRAAAVLEGHAGALYRVAFSADSQTVASGGLDSTVWLWATNGGRPLATLRGHAGAVFAVAFIPHQPMLASASLDGSVRVWETGSGRPVTTFQGHTEGVHGIAISADGESLASGSVDGTVRLWATESGRTRAVLSGHTGPVPGLAFSADGRTLASAGQDGSVRVWEADVGRALAVLSGHSGAVYRVAFDPSGRLLASASLDRSGRVWELPGGRLVRVLEGHGGAVVGVAVSPDERTLASSGQDGTVRLWDLADGQPLAVLADQPGSVMDVAFSADGRLLASGCDNGTVRVWEKPGWRLLASLEGQSGATYCMALSADGRRVASGCNDGTVRVWEPASGRPPTSLHGHTAGVWGVAMPMARPLLASASDDGTVKLWDLSTASVLRTLRPDRRYERLNITGVTGLTTAQRNVLLTLGAVERSG